MKFAYVELKNKKEKFMQNEKEEVIMEKATLVAFCSLRKLHVTPFKKLNGRVAFRVKGDVTKILADLQTNPKINILDFLTRLEAVRTNIFALKAGK